MIIDTSNLTITERYGHSHNRGFLTINFRIQSADGRVFETCVKTGGTNEDADFCALIKVGVALRDGRHFAVKQVS